MIFLAACSSDPSDNQSAAPPDLESAAIERGLVRDPADRDVIGLYARDTDRVCIVKQGSGYRVGAFADYGDGSSCSGNGSATRSGETLSIRLRSKDRASCAFDAKFDGERLTFPANLPGECASLCGPRATFAALEVERLSESSAEAMALRSAEGRRLCEN